MWCLISGSVRDSLIRPAALLTSAIMVYFISTVRRPLMHQHHYFWTSHLPLKWPISVASETATYVCLSSDKATAALKTIFHRSKRHRLIQSLMAVFIEMGPQIVKDAIRFSTTNQYGHFEARVAFHTLWCSDLCLHLVRCVGMKQKEQRGEVMWKCERGWSKIELSLEGDFNQPLQGRAHLDKRGKI